MVSKVKINLNHIVALLVQRFLRKWLGCSFLGDHFSAVARGGKERCLLFLTVGLDCGIGVRVDLKCNI